MSYNVIIRQADMNDLPVLKDFLQSIVEAERPMDSSLKPGFIEYYDPADFIHQNNATIIVAEIDNELVGCGAGQIRPSKHYYTHDQHVHLAMMFVCDEHRGKGINGMIVDALKIWGNDNGVCQFQLTVYPNNESAIRAYEKMGFHAALLEMRYNAED